LRLASALTEDAAVMVYPLSESCRDFFLNASPAAKFEICEPDWETKGFPRLVITDLRETHKLYKPFTGTDPGTSAFTILV